MFARLVFFLAMNVYCLMDFVIVIRFSVGIFLYFSLFLLLSSHLLLVFLLLNKYSVWSFTVYWIYSNKVTTMTSGFCQNFSCFVVVVAAHFNVNDVEAIIVIIIIIATISGGTITTKPPYMHTYIHIFSWRPSAFHFTSFTFFICFLFFAIDFEGASA